jgi:hypothetical protein
LDTHSILTSSRFDKVDSQTQLILASLLDNRASTHKTRTIVSELHDQVRTLTQIVSRLPAVNPDEYRQPRESIVEAGRRARRDHDSDKVEAITAKIEMFHVSEKIEEKHQGEVQRAILESLRYPMMSARYEEVLEAYPNTFEWIFQDSTEDQLPGNNFARWLKEGEGVYWISGKAGSGKSTLMKHIFDDKRLRQYLKEWARKGRSTGEKTPFFIASFFFWNGGTAEQKSQGGLLRALLHQVLDKYRELIPIVLPTSWASIYSRLLEGKPEVVDETWPVSKLMAAFKTLIKQEKVPIKLCFLIDGLDEFEGDHEEMAELFKGITKSHAVKACLSSRIWVVFKECFCDCLRLQLQDLTANDIQQYVHEKFNQSPAFRRLEIREPDSVPALLQEVILYVEILFSRLRPPFSSRFLIIVSMSSTRDQIPPRQKRQRTEAGPLLDDPSESQPPKRLKSSVRLHSAAFYDSGDFELDC